MKLINNKKGKNQIWICETVSHYLKKLILVKVIDNQFIIIRQIVCNIGVFFRCTLMAQLECKQKVYTKQVQRGPIIITYWY